MDRLDSIFNGIGGLFHGRIDEILFFVLAALMLFGGDIFRESDARSGENDTAASVFFIVLFLMLLLTSNDVRDE